MTKYIVKNPENISAVLKSVKQSPLSIADKSTIVEYVSNQPLTIDDKKICTDIRNENISTSLASIMKKSDDVIIDKSARKVTFES